MSSCILVGGLELGLTALGLWYGINYLAEKDGPVVHRDSERSWEWDLALLQEAI